MAHKYFLRGNGDVVMIEFDTWEEKSAFEDIVRLIKKAITELRAPNTCTRICANTTLQVQILSSERIECIRSALNLKTLNVIGKDDVIICVW
jgi:hypothetical protein